MAAFRAGMAGSKDLGQRDAVKVSRSKKLEQEFSEVEKRVMGLKEAERRLTALHVPTGLFTAEIRSIEAKLKYLSLVDEIEEELTLLAEKVAVYHHRT